MTLTCEHCGSNYPHDHHPGCIEGETARLRALLEERAKLLRECLPIVDAAAMSVRGYPGEETPNDLSRRIAATLKETT